MNNGECSTEIIQKSLCSECAKKEEYLHAIENKSGMEVKAMVVEVTTDFIFLLVWKSGLTDPVKWKLSISKWPHFPWLVGSEFQMLLGRDEITWFENW